jgi:hypothetical protein
MMISKGPGEVEERIREKTKPKKTRPEKTTPDKTRQDHPKEGKTRQPLQFNGCKALPPTSSPSLFFLLLATTLFSSSPTPGGRKTVARFYHARRAGWKRTKCPL